MERYEESQAVLDSLLETDSDWWRAVSTKSKRSYLGKAFYYKSYNYYLTEFPEDARHWIDRALGYLPQSKPLLYLTGVLHFDEDRFGEARSDLLKVVDGGTEICDAYYRLGIVESAKASRQVLYNFMNSGYCFERRMRHLHEELNRVQGLDLDRARKDEMANSLKNGLDCLGDEAAASLLNMITRANSIEELDRVCFCGRWRISGTA